MVLLACSIASRFQREDESYATNVSIEHRILTDKTEYVEGEPIMVTAWSSTPTDMVVIAPTSNMSRKIRWYYLGPTFPNHDSEEMCGLGSGIAYDIRNAYQADADLGDIPAGDYVIYLKNRQASVDQIYCYTTITVVAAQE